MSREYGNNYNKNLSLADITKNIRTYANSKIKDGVFPKGTKISVTKKNNSINITLTQYPSDMMLYNPQSCTKNRGAETPNCINFHPDIQRSIIDVEKYANSFNFNGSISEVDHFDVNFYGGRIQPSYEVEMHQRFKIAKCFDERGIYQPSMCKDVIEKHNLAKKSLMK